MGSLSKTTLDHSGMNELINWVDSNCTKALYAGPVVVTLGREARSLLQNDKAWPMYRDFQPIKFNGVHWQDWHWKNFLMSAFNQEMPVVGLLGEPVSMSMSTSGMSKKRFAEFIEFVYATGADRGVKWSEPAMKFYESICDR